MPMDGEDCDGGDPLDEVGARETPCRNGHLVYVSMSCHTDAQLYNPPASLNTC